MSLNEVLRLIHWGPILALSVIGTITTSTILVDLQWWPLHTPGGAVNMVVFLSWVTITLYNFFKAAFVGPGHVAYGWKPENKEDWKNLQYCNLCESYKAPRSHHCRKCQRCVMKMDHHCPWINNCVGHFNHGSFAGFLFFAPIGCMHAIGILVPAMYRAINRDTYLKEQTPSVPIVTLTEYPFMCALFSVSLGVGVTVAVGVLFSMQTYYIYYGSGKEPLVHLGIKSFIGCMFAVGLAIGVILAVGALFVIQIRSIIRNETGIETWIKDKAYYRDRDEEEPEFVFPYYLGKWNNFKMVFHWSPRPELNGLWWPVASGCTQFTLTIEQIKQKQEKKERSVEYHVKEAFSGALCPVTKGLKVFCCPPCTDEPRIAVKLGERVIVSRWKKHWLYGDKVLSETEAKRVRRQRGWFPRRCAAELVNGDHDHVIENETSDGTTGKVLKRLQMKKTD